MIKGKYFPSIVKQEWHLYETNYGDDKPGEDSLCLVITHNRDYAIAQYVSQDTVLCRANKPKNGLIEATLAETDGFYTLDTFNGEKSNVMRLGVTAWTRLPLSQNIFNAMLKKGETE